MVKLWFEFCHGTSIHGLRLIASTDRTYLERIVWLLVVFSAGLVLARLLYCNWCLYRTIPIQVVVNNPRLNLDSVDFPAVTVCTSSKVVPRKVEEHIARTLGPSANDSVIKSYKASLIVLDLMRYPYYHYPSEFLNLTKLDTYPIKNQDIPSIMKSVGPSVEDVFESCYWRGKKFNCNLLFRFQRTEEGYCYSFNSKTGDRVEMSDSNWPIKPPYAREDGSLEAVRNNAAGVMTGLQFKLKDPGPTLLNHVKHKLRGYNVMVHSPEKFPDESHRFQIHESPDLLARIMVTVSTVIAHNSLRDVPDEVRDCYWPPVLDDSEPDFSKEDGHCRQYCRINYFKQECNCTPYFFSTNETNKNVTFCSVEHVRCLATANVVLKNNGDKAEMMSLFPMSNFTNVMNCMCTKPCSYVDYDSDQLVAYPNFPVSKNFWAYVDVSYKHPWAISYLRYVKFGFQEFLVSTGSFAGLLLGGSLISILEIVYYLLKFTFHSVKMSTLKKSARIRATGNLIEPTRQLNPRGILFEKEKVIYPFLH